jgi:spore coat polysaccharide biosynthesis predicted glycosyltransferase SpsG
LYRGIDLHCGCFKTFVDPNFTDLRGEMIRRIGEDILLVIGSFLVSLTSLKKENIKE